MKNKIISELELENLIKKAKEKNFLEQAKLLNVVQKYNQTFKDKVILYENDLDNPFLIIKKLEEKFPDIEKYYNSNHNWEQKAEIIKGLWWNKEHPNEKIDIKKYSYFKYSASQMEQIRLGLQNKININFYHNLSFPAHEMKAIRIKLEKTK